MAIKVNKLKNHKNQRKTHIFQSKKGISIEKYRFPIEQFVAWQKSCENRIILKLEGEMRVLWINGCQV